MEKEVRQEIDGLMRRALKDQEVMRHGDLQALEMAIRASMHEVGGRLLEKLVNCDGGGYRGVRMECGQGHQAQFCEYRSKQVTTVLSPVEVERAYYHCGECGEGIVPKDQELDIVGTSLSPGVRRLLGRVGAKESFEEGRQDLEELAGVVVVTKQVERTAEQLGKEVEEVAQGERELALAGRLVCLQNVPKLYIAIDGTGVPVVPRETEGRAGKDHSGKAKTREAKLGCLFTQTTVDQKGRPVRDEDSTSYVGAIETAEVFGRRLYAEAVRRGVLRAAQVIVLGDGAPWIWNLADEHFPGAIQIVDLYHAREHLAGLAKLVYGQSGTKAKQWATQRIEQLDAGKVEQVVGCLRRLRPPDQPTQEAVRKTIDYFRGNAERMRYAAFRLQELFVGSGVVEAGCKSMGQRLKQSGMRWTVPGANAIFALRCCQLSGRWEEFWEARAGA